MIQIIELHPHPLSVEHPQFVAVKSLISDLQINIFYSIMYETAAKGFHIFLKKFIDFHIVNR